MLLMGDITGVLDPFPTAILTKMAIAEAHDRGWVSKIGINGFYALVNIVRMDCFVRRIKKERLKFGNSIPKHFGNRRIDIG